jgi:hypothetical protein
LSTPIRLAAVLAQVTGRAGMRYAHTLVVSATKYSTNPKAFPFDRLRAGLVLGLVFLYGILLSPDYSYLGQAQFLSTRY